MELDRSTIKAISAETRLKILKTLAKQKKMPSELSREIGISPSTVVGHLQNLESAGLVQRVETGHKWVYYAPTDKGRNLLQPRVPLQLALTLVLGAVMSLFGFLKYATFGALESLQYSTASEKAAEPLMGAASKAAADSSELGAGTSLQSPDFGWIYLLFILAGLAIIAYSIYKIRKSRNS